MIEHGRRPRLTPADLDVIEEALGGLEEAYTVPGRLYGGMAQRRRRIVVARAKIRLIAAEKRRLRRHVS